MAAKRRRRKRKPGSGPRLPRASAERVERERRRTRVSELLRDGAPTQREVAEALRAEGFAASQPTVCRDLLAVRSEWREDRVDDFDFLRSRQQRRIDHKYRDLAELYRELLADFARARAARTIDHSGIAGTGVGATKIKPERRVAWRRTDTRASGAVAAVAGALASVVRAQIALEEREAKLWGLDVPRQRQLPPDELRRRLASLLSVEPEEMPS